MVERPVMDWEETPELGMTGKESVWWWRDPWGAGRRHLNWVGWGAQRILWDRGRRGTERRKETNFLICDCIFLV